MFDIGEAFGYPLEGDDVASNLLIGSLLLVAMIAIMAISVPLLLFGVGFFTAMFAIVPQLVLMGYGISIIRSTIDGEDEPPTFDDWKELTIDGGRVFVVQFVYQLPGFVILVGGLFLTVGVGFLAASDPSEVTGALFGGSMLIVAALFTVYWLVVSYVLPAALCSMAHDGEINGAFNFGRIKRTCLTADYAVAVLLAGGVYSVIGNIAFGLMFILVGFPIFIYTIMVSARLVGSAYHKQIIAGG